MAKRSHSARGLAARGAKGAPREKLARAAGFASDAEIADLFPANRRKHATQVQQAIAELVTSLKLADISDSAIAVQYGSLMRALANPQAAEPEKTAPSTAPAKPPVAADPRANKQAALAAETLRQQVLEAVESPLAMLPSLLADAALTDQDKLKRLSVYAAALEALYDPLDLDPIGDPGQATTYDARHHESATKLSKGDACTIRQIGFRRGETVLRKAVVAGAE